MDWLGPLGVTLGYSFLSALVPIFNIEIYIVGLVTQYPDLAWWAIGLVAAVGQMAGKLIFYAAGRGAFRLPARLHRKTEKQRAGRFAKWLQRFHDTAEHRPIWSSGILLASAVVGIPPLLAMAFLAGLAEIRVSLFLAIGVVGRFVRFAAIAVSPGLLDFWFL